MLAKTQFNKEMVVCQRTCSSFLNKYPKSKYEANILLLLGDIIAKEKYSYALENIAARNLTIDSTLIER